MPDVPERKKRLVLKRELRMADIVNAVGLYLSERYGLKRESGVELNMWFKLPLKPEDPNRTVAIVEALRDDDGRPTNAGAC